MKREIIGQGTAVLIVAAIAVAAIIGVIAWYVTQAPAEGEELTVTGLTQQDTNLSHLEEAVVQANIVNYGDTERSTDLILKIGGEPVDEQTVTLSPGESKVVEFNVPPRDPGEYNMEVAGKTGTLTVNQFFVGYVPYLQAFDYHVMKRKLGGAVADHLGYKFMFKDPDCDPVEQKKYVEYLIANGAHAIIVTPISSESDLPELCHNNDVIFITQDCDIMSPEVDVNIRFGERKTGNILAEEIVKFLEDKYGEPRGLIFNVQMELTTESGIDRSEGLYDIVDEYPDIEVVDLPTEMSADKAFELTQLAIEAHGKPDAIYGCEGSVTLAGFNALEVKGWAIPAGEEGHVYVATYDAVPGVLSKMEQGVIDVAYAQPMPFYSGLAVYYAGQIEEKGRDAIPKIGTTLNAEDAPLHEIGIEFMGINVWKDPFWAPAEVVDYYGHSWIQTSGMLVTPANMDSECLWANMFRE